MPRNGSFFQQVQTLQKNLQELLEKDWGPPPNPEPTCNPPPFEVLTDLNQLEFLGTGLPNSAPEKSQILFDRLSFYFEAGLCFDRSTEGSRPDWLVWSLKSTFSQGEIFPLLPDDLEKKIQLPQMTLLEIRKLNPDHLLANLGLKDLLPTNDTRAFAIRPLDQLLWIFLTRLEDIFLENHITEIQKRILLILADDGQDG